MSRPLNCNETSTLIYSLTDDEVLPFDKFKLVVRALHSFRVNHIIDHPESKTVEVQLGYVCSLKNVRSKLGTIPATVAKLNPNLEISQLDEVAELQRRFGFGAAEEEEGQASKPAKKRRYKEVY